jgi:hypothetical protein
MKHFLAGTLLIISLFGWISVFSQGEVDVQRYLVTETSGTPRFASMAGAFGALGGDLSTPLVNPAGTAIYTRSEVVLTPGFTIVNSQNQVNDLTFNESTSNFSLYNIGFVGSSAAKSNNGTYFNFSMGYFQTKDFILSTFNDFRYDESSMLFDFVASSNGAPVEELGVQTPFYGALAWETFLMDEDTAQAAFYLTQPRYEFEFSGVNQSHRVDESGRLGEVYLNGSFAIQNRIFLGFSLGVKTGGYEQTSVYTENTVPDNLLLNDFSFTYTQRSTVGGIDAKAGVIIKPEPWLRMGLAYQFPFRLNIVDNFSTRILSNFRDNTFYIAESPEGTINYQLRSPGKVTASFALVKDLDGLISVDVEYIDYSNSRIESNEFDFSLENRRISENIRGAFSIRIGAEYWLGRYSIRAGYANRQNEFREFEPGVPNSFHTFAFGLGMLTKSQLFINLSGRYLQGTRTQTAYNPNLAPLETAKWNTLEFLIGGGIRF